jgi:biotin carboxyl carrier protein
MKFQMTGWKKLVLAAVVAGGCVLAGRRYHVVERIVPAQDVPTIALKKQPFVRKVSADGYLKAVKATALSAPSQAQGALKIAWMAPDGSKVSKGDLIVRFDPTEYEKKLQDGESDLASADAKIGKERVLADAAVRGRTRTADLSGAELAETRAFQKTDPEIFSRNQIIASGIDEGLSTARMAHANEARGIEGSLSKSKLDIIAIEKRKAELSVKQAQQGLHALEIRAPHDGIVVFEGDGRGNLPHVGDSVWAGQTIASLPLLEAMEAEIYVLEADAGGLQVGNVAKVILEAHPETPYDAKIRRVDTLAKPRVRDVPIQYFGVTLELARTDTALMKPGERVHATLILDSKDAVTAPRQAVFEKDGKTVVYRLENGRFEAVAVKLGASTPGSVAIEEGLGDGDRIALRDPGRPADQLLSPKTGDADPASKAAARGVK